MTLSPIWRTRAVAIGAGLLAVWLGSSVASQEFTLPGVVVGALGLLVMVVVQPVPLDALLLGAVVFGYIVGNRGFAQLSFTGSVPLLPAEFVLLVAGAIVVGRSTWRRVLPLRRDALNAAILVWMAISSVRLFSDLRAYGVMALRDYATVYYAAFFFLGQHVGETPSARRFIERCLIVGCLALAVIYPLFLRFPDVFLGPLALRGVPVIFFKGDLAGTFLALGAVLLYARYEINRSRLALVASLILAAGTIMTNNRASMLALVVTTGLLALARRWRFALIQATAGVAGAVIILFAAYVQHESWHSTPIYGVYERTLSLVDPAGRRSYSAEAAANKGDNNLFRMVWWRTVFDETRQEAPLVGLGFGYDLAARFTQEYYPEAGEEFTTRSPHNIVLTIFARTGVVGLLPFLIVVGLVLVRSVQVARRDLRAGALWIAAVAIFVSACFGVVLEGPMGAVVFWTMLGLANAAKANATEAPNFSATSDAPQGTLLHSAD